LKSITIPNGVTEIKAGTFFECKSLTSITIPESVTSIGKRAFYHCDSLAVINIPDSVTEIGEHAFEWCESLTSLTIPDSVTKIGYRAFESCTSLKEVYFKSITPPEGTSSAFNRNFAFYGKIYVPKESESAYKDRLSYTLYNLNNVVYGYDF
jgi:hypothetical protein